MMQIDSDLGHKLNQKSDAWLYIDELTHRTLNDYTSMLSIVRLATLNIANHDSRDALDKVACRLRAAAATLRELRPPKGFSSRSLDLELRGLCETISNSELANRSVTLSLISEPITLGAYRCWQISLIVAELITNAIRHAFDSRNGGSITIDLGTYRGYIECKVIDDGASNSVISPGRGSAIVDALASELGGSVFRTFGSNGSEVTLLIPALEVPGDPAAPSRFR